MAKHREWVDESHPLLGDDLVFPEQFYPIAPQRTPEVELVSSLYLDAIYILIGKLAATEEEWADARQWLNGDEDEFGSFIFCCRILGTNSAAVRRAILADLRRPSQRQQIYSVAPERCPCGTGFRHITKHGVKRRYCIECERQQVRDRRKRINADLHSLAVCGSQAPPPSS